MYPMGFYARNWSVDSTRSHSMMFRYLLPAALASLLGGLATGQHPGSDATMMAFEAGSMSAETAAKLERQLRTHSNDLNARTKLLGFYFTRRYRSPGADKSVRTHVLWLIRNRPDAAVLDTPYGQINSSDEAGYL